MKLYAFLSVAAPLLVNYELMLVCVCVCVV